MLKHSLAGLALAVLALPVAAQSYTVEPRHSHVSWAVSHFGTSTFRGKLNKTSGKVVLDAAAKTGSVEITVDARGMISGDEKLDKHLSAADFFDVEKFATATFKSTSVTFEGNAPKTIEGALTLRGVTRPVTLTVTHFHCRVHPMMKKDYCGADATATIKRTDWGMKYAVPAVSDEVKLDIAIEALKD